MVSGWRGREFVGESMIGSERVRSNKGGEGRVGTWVGLTRSLGVLAGFE